MKRARPSVLAVALAAGLVAGPIGTATAARGTTRPTVAAPASAAGLAPSTGALWGFYAKGNSDPRSYESQFGRPFDVAHFYADMSTGNNGAFPNATEKAVAARGDTLHIGWETDVWGGGGYTWSQVAGGSLDSWIKARAAAVKAFGKPMIIDFGHEADINEVHSSINKGTPAQYVAAYRHVVDLFRAAGATNVAWAWVVTGSRGTSDTTFASYYPGSSYVDWIGWDPYDLGSLESFAATASSFYNRIDDGFLGTAAKSKPRLLGEYGAYATTGRPAWLKGIPSGLKSLPRLKAVEYFDSGSGSWNVVLDPDSASMAAFRTAGLDPYVDTRG